MAERGTGRELYTDIETRTYRYGTLESRMVPVAREVPYTLFVNDREILSIATLPDHLEELFVGFLVSEGVVVSPAEVLECRVDHNNKIALVELDVPDERIEKVDRKGMLTSGCAGGMVFSVEAAAAPKSFQSRILPIGCSSILERMRDLDTYKGIYRVTKGVHGASVATPSETLFILEDIGRHNAVDKIVGYCFLKRIPTADKLLLTTGRVTSEVLSKASRGGFRIVISRSSVSAMAAQLARQCSIDVVSYVRARRFDYFANGGMELVAD